MTHPHAVVITGIGAHLGGLDAGGAQRAIRESSPLVTQQGDDRFDGLPEIPAVRATALELGPYLEDRKLQKYMNLGSKLAVLAAGRALEDGGLLGQDEALAECGLYVGCGLISFDLSTVIRGLEASVSPEGDLDLHRMGTEGLRQCHPLLPFQMLLNTSLGLVSIAYGVRGENGMQYPGPTQLGLGLETAHRGILHGRFPRALVGAGVDHLGLLPVMTMMRRGWIAASPEAAVPLVPGHQGVAPADAGAFLVLESYAAAAEREAAVYGTLQAVSATYVSNEVAALVGVWESVCGAVVPGQILVSGTLDERGDEVLRQASQRLWPSQTPELVSFDGLLGYGGAASVPLTTALAVSRCGQVRDPADRSPVLVTIMDPAGGCIALTVTPTEKGGRP